MAAWGLDCLQLKPCDTVALKSKLLYKEIFSPKFLKSSSRRDSSDTMLTLQYSLYRLLVYQPQMSSFSWRFCRSMVQQQIRKSPGCHPHAPWSPLPMPLPGYTGIAVNQM